MYTNKLIENIIQNNMMDFSQYVIKNRALPDIYSGMKPIHLKILWSMYENKTFNFTKSANVSGKVMVYSPHGDCYETIVNMVQKDRHIYNLIEGQGNWGSSCSTEMQYGASRYTECKMSALGIDCMQGISKNMVEMIDNYDNTKKMPKYLPTRFPLILCMASNGIAVGMANNSPSFNLEDVCNATISYLQNEEIPILFPDFATGSYIVNNTKEIKNINLYGKGTIKLRAKYEIKDNIIRVIEIPYGTKVSIETIIDKIIEQNKNGKLKEITNVLNQTGINGLCIEITCKKGTNMQNLMKKLYKLTPLESNFSSNMNVLVDGSPKVIGVHDAIKIWTEFRQRCITNGLQYDINNLTLELHVLQGLKKVLLDIDKTIDIIRHSDNVEQELKEYFEIDEKQISHIVNMKLKNINKDYIIKQLADVENMELRLIELKQIIDNPTEINKIIIEDLKDVIKKFKQPRRTEIIEQDQIEDISQEDLVESYNPTLILTSQQYLKKNRKYSASQKLKDDDFILQTHQCNNKDDLLLFTNQGRLLTRKVYEIEECQPSAYGTFIPNLLGEYLQEDEKIIYISTTKDYKGDLITIYDNGNIARTDLSAFKTKTNRQVGMDAYNKEQNLIGISVITKDIDILLLSDIGRALIVNTKDFNSKQSRNTQGNIAMRLGEEQKVVSCIIDTNEDTHFTLQTEKGKEKVFLLNDIAPTNQPNEQRTLYKYIHGKKGNKGNHIYYNKTDKVVKLIQKI